MSNVLGYFLLATSIGLLLFTISLQKSRRALERELSYLRDKQTPDEEIAKLKQEVRTSLEEEMRQKRIENDAEIETRKQKLNSILEDYKNTEFQKITLELEKFQNNLKVQAEVSLNEFKQKQIELESEIAAEVAKIEELRRNQIAITEVTMRKALETEQYCLTLDSVSLLEIKELQSVAYKYSRIRPVILKAIYDIYYAPEVKKLVSRIIGPLKVAGIYRICSKLDGRLYVGKSVDISERWVTHFKRAAGVETETTNLLYPAMRSAGLENFTFEIIEKVEDTSTLGQREKYWQEFYDAKTHGFSVR